MTFPEVGTVTRNDVRDVRSTGADYRSRVVRKHIHVHQAGALSVCLFSAFYDYIGERVPACVKAGASVWHVAGSPAAPRFERGSFITVIVKLTSPLTTLRCLFPSRPPASPQQQQQQQPFHHGFFYPPIVYIARPTDTLSTLSNDTSGRDRWIVYPPVCFYNFCILPDDPREARTR